MVGSLDERIPATLPLRQIKSLADTVLARMASLYKFGICPTLDPSGYGHAAIPRTSSPGEFGGSL